MEGKVKKPLRKETPLAITLAMLSLGGVACIVLMLGLALIPLLEVGGFCAEGGPYEIRQECPTGAGRGHSARPSTPSKRPYRATLWPALHRMGITSVR